MKKATSILSIIMALALFCATAASAAQSYADFPTRNITYICTGSAGGGLDLCARLIAPYIEKYLPGSGTVTVENVTGGMNWNGWTRLIKSEPDGYTICALATPQFVNYLNKSLNIQYTMDAYTPLVNCVTDYCVIAVRTDDERFSSVTDMKSLIDVLKKDAGTEYLCSLTSGGGADEIAMHEVIDRAGVKNLVGINYADGINASRAGFLGGETDIYFGKIGDSLTMAKEGKAKVLVVFASKRSNIMPDIATGAEQGYDIVLGSSRGIIVPNNVDPELRKLLEDACAKASADPEYLKKMADGGYEIDFMDTATYQAYLKDVEKMVVKYAEVLGYNK